MTHGQNYDIIQSMSAINRITGAENSAEATARYWLWRAGNAGSDEEQDLLRAKVNQTEAGVRGQVTTGDVVRDAVADRIVETHGGPAHVAARLAVFRALHADIEEGLDAEGADAFGVHYQTDYMPVGRLAGVLGDQDARGLPAKTQTYAYPDFAYATEQGEPITVFYGDFDQARSHILDRHSGVTEDRIQHLIAPEQ